MSKFLTIFICAFIAFVSAQDIALPRTVRTCKRDTYDYTSCLRLAIQESWMIFMRGIPEIGLQTLDPYSLDLLEHEYDNGQLRGKAVLKDLKVYGLANSRILAVRPEHQEKRFKLDIDIEIPKMLVEGDYKIDGSVGTYQIGGKGYFNVSLDGISATWTLDGRVENDRWVLEHFYIEHDLQKMRVYFDDFFNGNLELTKAVVKFMNDNWIIFYKGTIPTTVAYLDAYLTEFLNDNLFSKVSYEKLFP